MIRKKDFESDFTYLDHIPLDVDRYAKIIATGKFVPENVITNKQIVEMYDIPAPPHVIEMATGIKERRWDDKNLSVSDFITFAARECLDKAGIPPESLDKIIFSRLLGDTAVPATSLKVLKNLGVTKGIPVFDISVACSGFIHALDMAIRYIDAGDDYVLILTGARNTRIGDDVYFKDPQTIFLNGDGAAAVLIGPSKKKHFKHVYLFNDSSYFDVAYIPFGSALMNGDKRYNDQIFNMRIVSGNAVHDTALKTAVITTNKLLDEAGMTIDDIDIFITSDQTPKLLEQTLEAVNCPKEKSLTLSYKYGNTVAAMTPLILDEMINTGKLQRGMTVMMQAHGAGSSGGGFIFEY